MENEQIEDGQLDEHDLEGLPNGDESGTEASGEDESGAEGAEGAEASSEDESAEQQPTRGQNRVQRLANERAQEREARLQAEAEAKLHRDQAEFYRRQAEQLAQQRSAAPAAEPAYVDPDEQWRREMQAQVQRGLAQQADLADRAEFALSATKSPLRSKYIDQVEMELQKARAAGNHSVSREAIYLHLLGQDTEKNFGKKTPAAREAEQRIAAAKGKPVRTQSNVQATRGGKTSEERLRDVLL